MTIYIITLWLLISFQPNAANLSLLDEKLIYGDDDRVEAWQVAENEHYHKFVNSAAIVVRTSQIQFSEGTETYSIVPETRFTSIGTVFDVELTD